MYGTIGVEPAYQEFEEGNLTTFKAMTWNVKNLIRPAGGATEAVLAQFQQKITMLASIIKNLEPDVLALQEVGSEEPVRDLQRALPGIYPHRAVSTFPDARGIRVAFLSRYPLEQQEDIVEFPPGPALHIHDLVATGEWVPITRMSRGSLRIRITKDGSSVNLITTHLKSNLLSFPRLQGDIFVPRDEEERAQIAGIAVMRRTAEAVTLRMRANALLERKDRDPLLVLGDFNDVPEAQTSLILCGPPGRGIDTQDFDQPDQWDDARLFNLASAIPRHRRFSYFGRRDLIDQIFASSEFFPVGESGCRQLPEVDSHIDFVSRWLDGGEYPEDLITEIAPDHAPVTAVFEV